MVGRAVIGALFLGIFSGGGAYPADTSPWPMFRHDSRRTGRAEFAGPKAATMRWSYQLSGDALWNSPAIGADGCIYICPDDLPVYTLSPDGALRWSYLTRYVGPDLSPAVGEDGSVYLGACDYRIYALASSGVLNWSYEVNGFIYSCPAFASDRSILIGAGDGAVRSLSPSGELLWSYRTGGGLSSSPAIDTAGTVYIGSNDQRIYGLSSDGSLQWSHMTGGRVESSPSVDQDGGVFVGSRDGRFYAVSSEGAIRWSYAIGSQIYKASPALGVGGDVYIGSEYAFNAVSSFGTLRWSYVTAPESSLPSEPSSCLIDIDGDIYFGCRRNLYSLARDGSLNWSYFIGYLSARSSPALGSDGALYIGSREWELLCFQDPPGSPTAAPTETSTNTPTPTATATPVNYLELRITEGEAVLGGPVTLEWAADPDRIWELMGRPVAIWLAAAQGQETTDGRATVAEALSNERMYLFTARRGVLEASPFDPARIPPTWERVVFPLAGGATSGSMTFAVPADPSFGGRWVFEAAFRFLDTAEFVNREKPVEVSNVTVVR